MFLSGMGEDALKAALIIGILLICGIIAALIGILFERTTKLREKNNALTLDIEKNKRNYEAQINNLVEQNKALVEKNEELEKELMKYDKKRKCKSHN